LADLSRPMAVVANNVAVHIDSAATIAG
jgi:hypothetical protein